MTELEACKELLEFYENNKKKGWNFLSKIPDCPLCIVFSWDSLGCSKCTWTRFTGVSCGRYAKKNYNGLVAILKFNQSPKSEQWRIDRIAMLKEWIKVLEAE